MAIENLQVTATGLPEGVTIDSATGALSGTPAMGSGAFGEGGQTTYTASVTATATGLESAVKNVSIIVKKTQYEIQDSSGAKIGTISLRELQSHIADGTLLTDYAIGSQIIVPVHNLFGDPADTVRNCPFRFGTVRNFILENESTIQGLGLVSVYALPSSTIQFDAVEASNPETTIQTRGNNTWSLSALRQWMNSRGTNWWSASHSYDAQPTVAGWTDASGLLDCFPSTFIDVLATVRVTTAHPDNPSPSQGTISTITTFDKFFPLSLTEMNLKDTPAEDPITAAALIYGTAWEYYQQVLGSNDYVNYAPSNIRSFGLTPKNISNTSTAVTTALRSYYGTNQALSDVHAFSAQNYVATLQAKNACRVSPACVVYGRA